jgi:hypothetical protein
MEWLNTHIEFWHWFVLGTLLIIIEVFAPGFVFLWFGISAIVIALLSSTIAMSFTVQLLLWSVLSVSSLLIMRRFVTKKRSLSLDKQDAEQALMSQIGMVISTNAGKPVGSLRFPSPVFGDDQWEFECSDELDAGDKVIVIGLAEGRLIVEKHR